MNDSWRKNTILFLTSQTITLFGSSLVQYAIMWYITLETKSGVMMTISIICGFLPNLFLSPFAGVWADRYNRKKLIILSDSMIAIVTFLLVILFLMGYDSIWMLFIVSAIRAVGTGIQTPAIGAFLPQLVPTDKLMKINGINGSIQACVMLISPMISGALLSFATIEIIFMVDVVTAVIAVLILIFTLHVPVHEKAMSKQTTSYLSDLKEGLLYINGQRYIKKFFIFCAFFFLFATPVAFLTPLHVARFFGDEVWRLTAMEITFSIGMIAGGMSMASWGGFKNKFYTMTISSLFMGALTFILGFITNFWIFSFAMGLFGYVMPFFNTPFTVLLQEKVEDDYLGRVFGVLGMISSAMLPIGMLIFGPLSDTVKIEWLLIGTGLLLFIEGVFMMKSKVLAETGRPQ